MTSVPGFALGALLRWYRAGLDRTTECELSNRSARPAGRLAGDELPLVRRAGDIRVLLASIVAARSERSVIQRELDDLGPPSVFAFQSTWSSTRTTPPALCASP